MGTFTAHLKSNAVALIALFIALGGTSYAAVELKANSVGSKQIRNRSVTTADLAPAARGVPERRFAQVVVDTMTSSDVLTALSGAVRGEKGEPGPAGPVGGGERGPAGPTGEQGSTGSEGPRGLPGSTVAYGSVQADGAAELAYLATYAHTTEGTYCFSVDHGVVPSLHAVVATLTDAPSSAHASVRKAPADGACAGRDFEVTTYSGETVTDFGFDLMVM